MLHQHFNNDLRRQHYDSSHSRQHLRNQCYDSGIRHQFRNNDWRLYDYDSRHNTRDDSAFATTFPSTSTSTSSTTCPSSTSHHGHCDMDKFSDKFYEKGKHCTRVRTTDTHHSQALPKQSQTTRYGSSETKYERNNATHSDMNDTEAPTDNLRYTLYGQVPNWASKTAPISTTHSDGQRYGREGSETQTFGPNDLQQHSQNNTIDSEQCKLRYKLIQERAARSLQRLLAGDSDEHSDEHSQHDEQPSDFTTPQTSENDERPSEQQQQQQQLQQQRQQQQQQKQQQQRQQQQQQQRHFQNYLLLDPHSDHHRCHYDFATDYPIVNGFRIILFQITWNLNVWFPFLVSDVPHTTLSTRRIRQRGVFQVRNNDIYFQGKRLRQSVDISTLHMPFLEKIPYAGIRTDTVPTLNVFDIADSERQQQQYITQQHHHSETQRSSDLPTQQSSQQQQAQQQHSRNLHSHAQARSSSTLFATSSSSSSSSECADIHNTLNIPTTNVTNSFTMTTSTTTPTKRMTKFAIAASLYVDGSFATAFPRTSTTTSSTTCSSCSSLSSTPSTALDIVSDLVKFRGLVTTTAVPITYFDVVFPIKLNMNIRNFNSEFTMHMFYAIRRYHGSDKRQRPRLLDLSIATCSDCEHFEHFGDYIKFFQNERFVNEFGYTYGSKYCTLREMSTEKLVQLIGKWLTLVPSGRCFSTELVNKLCVRTPTPELRNNIATTITIPTPFPIPPCVTNNSSHNNTPSEALTDTHSSEQLQDTTHFHNQHTPYHFPGGTFHERPSTTHFTINFRLHSR